MEPFNDHFSKQADIYAQSWSAYNGYTQQHNENPLNVLIPRLTELWKEDEVREVVWPLHLKCAYVH